MKLLLLILVLISTCCGIDWNADSVLNVQLHFACNTIRHSDQYTTLYWNDSTWIDIRQFPEDYGQCRIVVHLPGRKQGYAVLNDVTDRVDGEYHISTLRLIRNLSK